MRTGFRRNSTAPACVARFSSSSLAQALRKIIGICRPLSASHRCNSKPSIPGMRTSTSRQAAWARCSERSNSSAQLKARLEDPTTGAISRLKRAPMRRRPRSRPGVHPPQYCYEGRTLQKYFSSRPFVLSQAAFDSRRQVTHFAGVILLYLGTGSGTTLVPVGAVSIL